MPFRLFRTRERVNKLVHSGENARLCLRREAWSFLCAGILGVLFGRARRIHFLYEQTVIFGREKLGLLISPSSSNGTQQRKADPQRLLWAGPKRSDGVVLMRVTYQDNSHDFERETRLAWSGLNSTNVGLNWVGWREIRLSLDWTRSNVNHQADLDRVGLYLNRELAG